MHRSVPGELEMLDMDRLQRPLNSEHSEVLLITVAQTIDE